MKQAVPYLGRYLSKFVFEIIPGALVSVLAAYFLSMLHLARGAEPTADPPVLATTQSDGLSADQRRELTRQMLKERRENPEEPAEVKPIPSLRPTAAPAETANLAPQVPPVAAPQVAAPQAAAPQPASSLARGEAAAGVRPPRRGGGHAGAGRAAAAPRRRPTRAARASPECGRSCCRAAARRHCDRGLAGGGTRRGAGAATPLPPVTVNTTPPDAAVEPPPRRSFVGNVFSSFSSIAGGAANVTGNTVNWVIDLPGKAISAGGRLLGAGSAPAPAPAPVPLRLPQRHLRGHRRRLQRSIRSGGICSPEAGATSRLTACVPGPACARRLRTKCWGPVTKA